MTEFSPEARDRLARAMEEWRRLVRANRGTRDLVDEMLDALTRQSFEVTDVMVQE